MPTTFPIIKVVQRELNRILKDKVYFFIGIIAPVIGFSLVALVFSSNVPRKLPVSIVDQDHTSLSRKIVRMIGAAPVVSPESKYPTVEEARKAVISGDVTAIVVIPEGTQGRIIRGEQADIAVYVNNAYLIKGGLLKSGIQKAVGTLSAGIRLQTRMMWGESTERALASVQAVRLNPVLLFNPFTNYEYYLTLLILPVMLTVFVLFGTIYALGTELQYGTGPEWLGKTGNRILPALSGKLIPHFAMYLIVAIAMNLIFFRVLGLPLKGHYLMILFAEIVMILSYQSMAVFMIVLTRNLRLALSLASAYTMLAITFAGLTFPAFGMPGIAQVFSKIFPFTYWLDIFIGQTLRGEPLSIGLQHLWTMVVFIAAGICTVPRFKYILQTPKFWGKI